MAGLNASNLAPQGLFGDASMPNLQKDRWLCKVLGPFFDSPTVVSCCVSQAARARAVQRAVLMS